jgi:hypothetical protein
MAHPQSTDKPADDGRGPSSQAQNLPADWWKTIDPSTMKLGFGRIMTEEEFLAKKKKPIVIGKVEK